MFPKTETPAINVRYRPLAEMVPDGSLTSGLLVMGTVGNDLRKAQYSLLDWAFFFLDCVPIIVCKDQRYFDSVVKEWKSIKGIPSDVVITNAVDTYLTDIKQQVEAGKLPFVVTLDVETFPIYSEYDEHSYGTLRNFAMINQCLVGTADKSTKHFGGGNRAYISADYLFQYNGDWNDCDETVTYSCSKLRAINTQGRKDEVEIGYDANELFTEVKKSMDFQMKAPTVEFSLSRSTVSNLKEVLTAHRYQYEKTNCLGSALIIHTASVVNVLPWLRDELEALSPGCRNTVIRAERKEDLIAHLHAVVADKVQNIFVYGCGDSVITDVLDVLSQAHGAKIHITR